MFYKIPKELFENHYIKLSKKGYGKRQYMKNKKCKNCIACSLFCTENKNLENLKKIANREKYKSYKYGKHRRVRYE